jgi:uncharacterized protein
MKRVFCDASHFVALLSVRDRWHSRAIELNRQRPGPLVTTEWIMTEVGDAFSLPTSRPKFIRLLELLRQQPDAEIVPASTDLFQRGVEFFARRPDKEWSLTDCISFVVMRDQGITDALSNDHHFEQAGFRILLKN